LRKCEIDKVSDLVEEIDLVKDFDLVGEYLIVSQINTSKKENVVDLC